LLASRRGAVGARLAEASDRGLLAEQARTCREQAQIVEVLELSQPALATEPGPFALHATSSVQGRVRRRQRPLSLQPLHAAKSQ
jgi:hypothetical protein